ncbi:MAG: nucleotidyltransferase domain-containing protein [Bdellovibrionaceae bacterium]|nr:nucleotidyltransferase domain-containing protein [Pseudobdellovibrionaceae bacterium]
MSLQTSGLSASVIEKISGVFAKHPAIKKVILYGSRAKGGYRTGSDIDLTVIESTIDLSDLLLVENEIDELMLPYKVDLSIFEKIENENLRDHINRVGQVFYTRS